ncbi:hypothetical protein EXW58_28610 (plasmid) [Bacillus mycoides]|uniref:hypothetical protein n=1 Tax=Bacillus mycoides TaxID=1405 RepID=UPI001C009E9D|nr:hypothetical protein [Bacillus mycoides]QWG31357.1 hypothetical protein EXW58_28610 [Bacillus mycoides]
MILKIRWLEMVTDIYMGNHVGLLDNPEEFFEVDISEPNPYIAEFMDINGDGLLDIEDIEKIKTHKSIIYLISEGVDLLSGFNAL